MKRLLLACLLAVFSHGSVADVNPKCYQLFEQFEEHWRDRVKAGGIAGGMYHMGCWPALQDASYTQPAAAAQPVISTCNDLSPHIIQLANADEAQLMKIYDPKPMSYDTIDRVAGGHNLFQTIADNKGRSARVRQSLKHDDKVYMPGKQHYMDAGWAQFGGFAPPDAPTYGDKGTVLIPNSPPFTASPPTGTRRILDCSAEGRYTFGMWLIQMYLDRDSSGEEFIGMAGLMELR